MMQEKEKRKRKTIVDKCVCCFTKHFRFNRVPRPSGFFSCCCLLHSSLVDGWLGIIFVKVSARGQHGTGDTIKLPSRRTSRTRCEIYFFFCFLLKTRKTAADGMKETKTSRQETKAKCRMLRFSQTALPTHQLAQ